MKFDRSNKFVLCYFAQVNPLRLRLSVASKWASEHLGGGGNIYFAGDCRHAKTIRLPSPPTARS